MINMIFIVQLFVAPITTASLRFVQTVYITFVERSFGLPCFGAALVCIHTLFGSQRITINFPINFIALGNRISVILAPTALLYFSLVAIIGIPLLAGLASAIFAAVTMSIGFVFITIELIERFNFLAGTTTLARGVHIASHFAISHNRNSQGGMSAARSVIGLDCYYNYSLFPGRCL